MVVCCLFDSRIKNWKGIVTQTFMNAKQKIMIAMTAFGTMSLFVKNIALSSKEIAFFRGLIALLVLLLVLFFRRQSGGDRRVLKRRIPLLLISGACIGLNWIFLFEAYRYVPVSVATLCYYFAPTLVTGMSFLLFRERLNGRQLLCFFSSTAGLFLVLNVSGGNLSRQGIFCGLLAAVLYASVILMNKSIKQVDDIERTAVQFAGAVVTLLPYILCTGGFHFEALTQKGLMLLLVLGVFHTGICYCLYFSSLKVLTGQQAGIYSYLDPLVAILISMLILREPVTGLQLLGGGVILLAAIANEKPLKLKRESDHDKRRR